MTLTFSDVMAYRATILAQTNEDEAQALTRELKYMLRQFFTSQPELACFTDDSTNNMSWAELEKGRMNMGIELGFFILIGRYYITEFNFELTNVSFGCHVKTLFFEKENQHMGLCEIAQDESLKHFVEADELDELVRVAIQKAKEHNIELLADCGIVYLNPEIRAALMAKEYPFSAI